MAAMARTPVRALKWLGLGWLAVIVICNGVKLQIFMSVALVWKMERG
jgi:hypothetical protein